MYLKLTLEAPLQSWGGPRVNGDYFPTEKKPTKSGIIGLIACVMGIARKDPRLDDLSERIEVYCVPYENDGIMTDFHIIEVNKNRPVYLANRTAAKDKGQTQSIVTKRSYIQSGKFDIYISSSDEFLEEIENAFLHPFWTPYLGRKCCSVSSPLIPVWVDAIDTEAQSL